MKRKKHQEPPVEETQSAAEETAAETETAADAPDAGGDADPAEPLRAEIAALEDKLARTRAELQNYRRQSEKRLADERRFIARDLYAQMLPIVDTFGAAMGALEKGQDPANVLVGVKMIHQMLGKLLEDNRVQEIPTQDRAFDPDLHEAVARQESAEVEPNTVLAEVQKGYRMGDLVLRHARVIVASRPAVDAQESKGPSGDASGQENRSSEND